MEPTSGNREDRHRVTFRRARDNSEYTTTATDQMGEFFFNVAAGEFPKLKSFRQLGHNLEVNIAAAEDVWDGGGNYPFPIVQDTLTIVSTNINDTLLGTGLRKVLVSGLDNQYLKVEEEISLNGTTPVITTLNFFRINNVTPTENGNTGSNEGDVSVNHTTSNALLALLQIGFNRSFSTIFTVPANHRVFIPSVSIDIGPPKAGIGPVVGEVTLSAGISGGTFVPFLPVLLNSAGNSAIQKQLSPPFCFHEKVDLKFRFDSHQECSKVVVSYSIIEENLNV